MLYDKDWAKEIIKQWSEDSETPDNVKKQYRTKEQGMTYMGTSSSSNGPGSGVSLDPPWLDDIEIPNIIKQPSSDKTGIPLILAPKSRFGNARRNMGEYVRSEAEILLRKSFRTLFQEWNGRARQLSQRMRTSTKVAANFVNTFRSLRDDESFELRKVFIRAKKDKNASARKVINTIIEAVCPNGGVLMNNQVRILERLR